MMPNYAAMFEEESDGQLIMAGAGQESQDVKFPISAVNHPKHYNREGAMECIDEMILLFGLEATMNFCECNAWKYRYRAADKNGEEDLKKSDWYLKKYAELKESLVDKNN